ncbi:glycine cleavage system protein H, partial [Burkholderia multivorans]
MAELDSPVSYLYSKDHEWVHTTEDNAVYRVGITDFAQSQLGDVVYVDLPAVGDAITMGESCGEVESTKS